MNSYLNDEEEELVKTKLNKKKPYQWFKNVDLASFWREGMLFYWYLSVSILLFA